jgi:hypothetical protein
MRRLWDTNAVELESSQEFVAAAACRGCGAASLTPILALGRSPLANGLVLPEARSGAERRYPLEVLRCPACSLVQLSISMAPDLLFRE